MTPPQTPRNELTQQIETVRKISEGQQHGSYFSGTNTAERGNIYQFGNIGGDIRFGKTLVQQDFGGLIDKLAEHVIGGVLSHQGRISRSSGMDTSP